MQERLIARWQTRGGRYWLELYKTPHPRDYRYRGDNCGGGFTARTDGAAVARMERIHIEPAATISRIHYRLSSLAYSEIPSNA